MLSFEDWIAQQQHKQHHLFQQRQRQQQQELTATATMVTATLFKCNLGSETVIGSNAPRVFWNTEQIKAFVCNLEIEFKGYGKS